MVVFIELLWSYLLRSSKKVEKKIKRHVIMGFTQCLKNYRFLLSMLTTSRRATPHAEETDKKRERRGQRQRFNLQLDAKSEEFLQKYLHAAVKSLLHFIIFFRRKLRQYLAVFLRQYCKAIEKCHNRYKSLRISWPNILRINLPDPADSSAKRLKHEKTVVAKNYVLPHKNSALIFPYK